MWHHILNACLLVCELMVYFLSSTQIVDTTVYLYQSLSDELDFGTEYHP